MATSIYTFLIILLTRGLRYFFFHIDLIKITYYPFICIVVLFNIYLIRFSVKHILLTIINLSKLNLYEKKIILISLKVEQNTSDI